MKLLFIEDIKVNRKFERPFRNGEWWCTIGVVIIYSLVLESFLSVHIHFISLIFYSLSGFVTFH